MDVVADSVNVTTYFNLRLAADGTAATGLTIADLDLQYVRSGETPAAKVDAVALAATNTAHTDNRAIEIDGTDQPGLYRVDWPDAAFAAGVREVILSVKHSTTFIEHLRVNLTPVPADVSRVLSTTLTEGAAGRLAGGIVKWFNVASPTGTVNSVPDAVAGAAGGLVIAGSNADTTFATLTVSGAVAFQSTFAVTTSTSLAALSCTTLTASGAVAFQSTFAVTTSTSLAALSCTTLTASGAVAFQSTFAVTTSTSLAALSATTFATSGTTTLNALTVTNAFTVSGATVMTGNVSMAAGLTITQSTTNGAGVSITGNGSGAGMALVSGSTSGASAMTLAPGGSSNHGLTITANSSRHAINLASSTGRTINSGNTNLGALSADSFNVVGDALVSGTTTLTGAVSLGSTLGVTGTATFAAVTATGTVTLNALTVSNAFTVSGATTLTGAVTATHASNDILGVTLSALDEDSTTIDLDATIRAAVGMASANLDTQLAAIDDYIDSEIAAIKTVTDQFTAAQAEPTAAPAANATPLQKIAWLACLARNLITQTATTQTLKADNGTTTVATSTHSDDGTTYSRGEWS